MWLRPRELDEIPAAARLREIYCGGLDEQISLCWGHSNQLNALEWHTCNEFNIAVRELVLLLAKREDLDEDGRLNADKVQAFYLAQGEMIEVYSDTLHFCPCEVTGSGFCCIVGLQRGTNLPIAPEQKVNRLWAGQQVAAGTRGEHRSHRAGRVPGNLRGKLENQSDQIIRRRKALEKVINGVFCRVVERNGACTLTWR